MLKGYVFLFSLKTKSNIKHKERSVIDWTIALPYTLRTEHLYKSTPFVYNIMLFGADYISMPRTRTVQLKTML